MPLRPQRAKQSGAARWFKPWVFTWDKRKAPAGGDGASLPPRPATGAGGLGSDRQTANATSRRGVHSSAITCALSTEYSGSLAMLAVTRLAWSLVMRTCTTALYSVEPRRRRRSCGSFHRDDLDAAPTIAAKRAASFGAAAFWSLSK